MLSGQSSMVEGLIGANPGNNEVGMSMFETIGQPPKFGPSAAQMADAMQRLQVQRKVDMKEVCVRTYDLSNEKELTQYQTDLEHILIGVPLKTHVLLCKLPPQFVSDGNGSRYIAHMQWVEYRLTEQPVPTTAQSKGA